MVINKGSLVMSVTQSAANPSKSTLTHSELSMLLDVVEHTIHCYLNELPLPKVLVQDYPESLALPGACFVTLTVNNQLQGCIGTTVAQIPLVLEVERKAWAAACQDRRFTPLQKHQAEALNIEVSVLTQPELLHVDSEQDLLQHLSLHQCGVTLKDGKKGALFLPQVWEQLPNPAQFLGHLKQKAGWPLDFWSDSIQVATFEVQALSRPFRRL